MLQGVDYYVDSVNGSDSNSGISEASPWQSLARVHAQAFRPGDVVHFRCGSSWNNGLVIDNSGVEGHPIIFTTYGSGPRPIFRKPGGTDAWTNAVTINADWVVVQGFLVREARKAGVYISNTSNHNIVRDVEVTDVGVGIEVLGQYNLITRCFVHHLNMVRNTPGGDDDYGAVGVWLYSPNNEISYNRMLYCIAPSYDYGMDGGAVELFGPADSCYIHHNWAEKCKGFVEVGGGSARNIRFAYNVSVNNGRFSLVHLTGRFASVVSNLRVENNTILEVEEYSSPRWVLLDFIGSPTAGMYLLRNNILFVNDFWYISDADRMGWRFTHDHNLYYLANPRTAIGFALGEGEQIAHPLFADLTLRDLHLQPQSPAIDAGANLGYTRDFDGQVVPFGSAPDLGAFEYGSQAPTATYTPAPGTATPTPIHTSTPTRTPAPAPDELIIDDSDPTFSTTSAGDPWIQYAHVGGQHYGDTHYYNRVVGEGKDVATWAFAVPRPGPYNVYAWWWDGSWRPNDVPWTINHLGGATTVRVNQQVSGARWNLLGTFPFQGEGSISVSDGASSGSDIIADAVRLVSFVMPYWPPDLWIGTFGLSAGGWSSQDRFPRLLADVNGDKKADIIAFGRWGAQVSLSNGGGFEPPTLWIVGYGVGAGGWSSQELYPRAAGDVNGDGQADIVGFGRGGVFVSLSTGTRFTTPTLWLRNLVAGAGGWISQTLYPRLLGDVNGDGKMDIVAFGRYATYVSLSTGAGFAPPKLWIRNYAVSAGGWTSQETFPRAVADVNGDGMADIVGFGSSAVHVSLSTGSSFSPPVRWTSGYSRAGGWSSYDLYPRLVGNVDDDRQADIVGFGKYAVLLSLATGERFGPPIPWSTNFGLASGGWPSQQSHPRFLADVNGDDKADIVGFGAGGTYVSLAN
jgi:hypothetical protein